MSRSIGSHILLEKLVQPNWDFVRNLLVRAKIASNLLVGKGCGKDRECRTNMASIASLTPDRAMAPCNGCLRRYDSSMVAIRQTEIEDRSQRHFNADEVTTPACPCVVYIYMYSSLWSAGATPRLKT